MVVVTTFPLRLDEEATMKKFWISVLKLPTTGPCGIGCGALMFLTGPCMTGWVVFLLV